MVSSLCHNQQFAVIIEIAAAGLLSEVAWQNKIRARRQGDRHETPPCRKGYNLTSDPDQTGRLSHAKPWRNSVTSNLLESSHFPVSDGNTTSASVAAAAAAQHVEVDTDAARSTVYGLPAAAQRT